jgi:hypothetical protein
VKPPNPNGIVTTEGVDRALESKIEDPSYDVASDPVIMALIKLLRTNGDG